MCKFKYKLFDKLYLKERCSNIPLGANVTIVSRVHKGGVNYYTVVEGKLCSSEPDNISYDVKEDLLSVNPPFQIIYKIQGEILARQRGYKHLPCFRVERMVVGNLEEAFTQFDCVVRACEEAYSNNGQYGKCILYELEISDKGIPIPLSLISEDKIIKQKFFMERG